MKTQNAKEFLRAHVNLKHNTEGFQPLEVYKNYLRLLQKKPKFTILGKIFLAVLAVIFIVAGGLSAVFYYQYKKDLPIKAENIYLEKANKGLISVNLATEELLGSFKIAGVKVQLIDKTKESSPSALGYFVSLDDIGKNVSKIQLTKENIQFQKNLLSNKPVPGKFKNLHSELLNFYEQSDVLLESISEDLQFSKELLIVLGPDFYLPTLTNQTLWSLQNKDEITNYYLKTKDLAASSLEKLQKLQVPDNFSAYYDSQLKYFELVVNVSNNIINILESPEDTDIDSASQIEKAYQLLVGASRENEVISQKLLDEKLKLFDLEKNLERFSSINLVQYSLRMKLDDYRQVQPQSKLDQSKAGQLIQKFFRGFTNIQ